ncbi:MAG: DUF2339 domain-containing protein [Bacteroidota bacterium]
MASVPPPPDSSPADSDSPSIEERLARLENRVDRLVDVVKELHARQEGRRQEGRRPERRTSERERLERQRAERRRAERREVERLREDIARPATAGARGADPSLIDEARERASFVFRSEDWLNRLGIALLLIGLAFLFRYSIEQGWVGPLVRVGFGVALGAGLIGLGLRLRPKRLRYGQALMGGGLAVLYTTLFAAFQLYELLSYPVAFGAMLGVTALGFVLAHRCGDVLAAVVATQGGLSTPFLLYTGDGDIAALVGYTAVLLTCAFALFALRGWRTLLATAVVGGWLVLGSARAELIDLFVEQPRTFDHTVVLAGAVYAGLLFWAVPLWRAVQHHQAPERWPRPPLTWFRGNAWAEEPVRLLAVLVPLVTWVFIADLFEASEVVSGLLLLAVGAGWAATMLWLRRLGLPGLASAHGVAAALLASIAAVYLGDGLGHEEALGLGFFTLVMAGTHVAARHLDDLGLRITGYGLATLVVLLLVIRIGDGGGTMLFISQWSDLVELADLVALALLGAAAATLASGRIQTVYLLATYVLALGWLWRELEALDNGQALVSVAWGAVAIGMLALGWQRRSEFVRRVGLATLLVVVGKLFVVDLAELDAIWRILLFLGFGALLMLISYLVPSLWRSDESDGDQPKPTASPETGVDAAE